MSAPTLPLHSHELLKANQRLEELRREVQSNRAESGQAGKKSRWADVPPWEVADPDVVSGTAVDLLPHLPSHLGWGSMAASEAVRTALRRHNPATANEESSWADHPISCSNLGKGDKDSQPLGVSLSAGPGTQLLLPFDGDTIKHYPTIGIAALQTEQAAIYRVWLLCRYLDEQGRGWLPVANVRQQLTDKESKLRLFGWRRLRQVLGQGHGRFWQWDKVHHRLWLFGAARIAANLGVSRLVGKPVSLPVKSVTSSIGEFKAHLYGAWHSGRKHSNPISREVHQTLTNIPERTQRHYCQIARIQRKTNIAIGSKHNPKEAEKQAWQRGQATFQFIDHQGRQGRKGTTYIAWRLPNSYIGPHAQSTNGRMRKINRRLTDLVKMGTQGNNRKKVTKKYLANGAVAVRVLNQGKGSEVYWPMVTVARSSNLWTVFSLP